ncbi:uncharacterized protein LOC141802012 [Halichoeres trimaculatus]|uniref:uncharacterized protein LOC141802012 n=1 Tax=Halichoeres trimaculatus TaxID=147232 RepID=UPI003D9E2823
MESEDGEVMQRVEKVTLRRKLTGPPRLLLPKRTRTKRTDRHKTNNNESSQKKTDKDVLSAVEEGSSRGHCEAAAEDDDITNRKVKRRRWWRRFTPELECVRGQRTKDEDVPPEGALQETHDPTPKNTDEEEKSEEAKAGRSRFKVKTWSKIRRMRDFLKRRRSTVDEEEAQQIEEGKCSPHGLTTGGSVEVMVEVSNEPPRAERVKTFDLKEEGEAEGQTDDAPDEDLEVLPSTEETNRTPSSFLCSNGPSILIQLVPPDEATLDGEEDEVWELSTSSSENQNLLFLLLTSEPGERQLLQTARSLVRAAMRAAVDQLSRERNETNCLEGCPDLTLMAERSKVNV